MKKNRKNIEIAGIPTNNPDNYKAYILKVAEVTNLEIEDKDIKRSFRQKQRGDKPGIIEVEFEEVVSRDQFMKAVKGKKPTAEMIGLQGRNKIFINEKLTSKAKQILYRVKQIAIQKKWASVWTYAAKVYLKMEQNGNPIKISSEEDIEILIK